MLRLPFKDPEWICLLGYYYGCFVVSNSLPLSQDVSFCISLLLQDRSYIQTPRPPTLAKPFLTAGIPGVKCGAGFGLGRSVDNFETLDMVVHGESQTEYTDLKIKPWCTVICVDREMTKQKYPGNGHHLLQWPYFSVISCAFCVPCPDHVPPQILAW